MATHEWKTDESGVSTCDVEDAVIEVWGGLGKGWYWKVVHPSGVSVSGVNRAHLELAKRDAYDAYDATTHLAAHVQEDSDQREERETREWHETQRAERNEKERIAKTESERLYSTAIAMLVLDGATGWPPAELMRRLWRGKNVNDDAEALRAERRQRASAKVRVIEAAKVKP